MKIGVIGTVGYPARYGGFETLVSNLVDNCPDDCSLVIFAERRSYAVRPRRIGRNEIRYLPFRANGIQSIPYDWISIIIAAFRCDGLLILGVSGCTVLPLVRLLSRCRVVTNIDGLEWKRDKWNPIARMVLRLSEFFAVTFSDAVVADNQGIVDHVRKTYRRRPTFIAYGGDQHLPLEGVAPASLRPDIRDTFFCLAMSRIEPENHCEEVLRGAILVNTRLVYVGNWFNSAYSRRLWETYGNCPGIVLLDRVYDGASVAWLRKNASVYVHGHSAGGTNPSLVEAMCHGQAVVAYDCNYNRYTTENAARYFRDVQELADELRTLIDDEISVRTMGARMREIATRCYGWRNVSRAYFDLMHKSRAR